MKENKKMANRRVESKKNYVNEVTEVRVFPVGGKSSLLANCGVTINNCIVIYVKLVESRNGDLFVSYPSHSYKDGKDTKYKDDVFFLDDGLRNDIVNAVIDAYNKA